MGEERLIEEQTVKALSWQLLYGNYQPRLGEEGWQKLSEMVRAPEFRKMDPDEVVIINCNNSEPKETDVLLRNVLEVGIHS